MNAENIEEKGKLGGHPPIPPAGWGAGYCERHCPCTPGEDGGDAPRRPAGCGVGYCKPHCPRPLVSGCWAAGEAEALDAALLDLALAVGGVVELDD